MTTQGEEKRPCFLVEYIVLAATVVVSLWALAEHVAAAWVAPWL
jgi:hypothetical protein